MMGNRPMMGNQGMMGGQRMMGNTQMIKNMGMMGNPGMLEGQWMLGMGPNMQTHASGMQNHSTAKPLSSNDINDLLV